MVLLKFIEENIERLFVCFVYICLVMRLKYDKLITGEIENKGINNYEQEY